MTKLQEIISDKAIDVAWEGAYFGPNEDRRSLFFCQIKLYLHKDTQVCERCLEDKEPFEKKGEHPDWVKHVTTHPTWIEWRKENPTELLRLQQSVHKIKS